MLWFILAIVGTVAGFTAALLDKSMRNPSDLVAALLGSAVIGGVAALCLNLFCYAPGEERGITACNLVGISTPDSAKVALNDEKLVYRCEGEAPTDIDLIQTGVHIYPTDGPSHLNVIKSVRENSLLSTFRFDSTGMRFYLNPADRVTAGYP